MKGYEKSLSQRGKGLLEMIQIQKDKEKTKIFNCRQNIPAQLKKKRHHKQGQGINDKLGGITPTPSTG